MLRRRHIAVSQSSHTPLSLPFSNETLKLWFEILRCCADSLLKVLLLFDVVFIFSELSRKIGVLIFSRFHVLPIHGLSTYNIFVV